MSAARATPSDRAGPGGPRPGQALRPRHGAGRRRPGAAPGRGARGDRRQRRRQVVADQVPVRGRGPGRGHDHASPASRPPALAAGRPGRRASRPSTSTWPSPRPATSAPTSTWAANCASPACAGSVLRLLDRRAMRERSRELLRGARPGHHPEPGPAGRDPLRRPAAGRRGGPGRRLRQPGDHHGRADGRAGGQGVRPGARAHRADPGPRHPGHPDQPRHAARLRGLRPDPHPAARPAHRLPAHRGSSPCRTRWP